MNTKINCGNVEEFPTAWRIVAMNYMVTNLSHTSDLCEGLESKRIVQ